MVPEFHNLPQNKSTYLVKKSFTILSIILATFISLFLLYIFLDGKSQILIIYRNYLIQTPYNQLGYNNEIEKYEKILEINEKLTDNTGIKIDEKIAKYDQLNLDLLKSKLKYETYFEFKNQYEISISDAQICYETYDINNQDNTDKQIKECINKLDEQLGLIETSDEQYKCLAKTKEYISTKYDFYKNIQIYNNYLSMKDIVNSSDIKNTLEIQNQEIPSLHDLSVQEYQVECPDTLLESINTIEKAIEMLDIQ